MKKLFALAMAALLMLPACGAYAEFADAFPAVTITGALTVDRDAVREAMAGAGLPESEISLWDGLLALLADAEDRLVIADEGFEYSLTGGDEEAMFIAGERRDGEARIVSSLFPNTVLTGEASGNDWQEIAAASEAVVGHLTQTVDAVAAAVRPDVPEFGRFEIKGETFDMRVPLHFDVAAMAEAGAVLVRGLIADETLRAAGLDGLSGYGALRIDADALPTVTAARYSADGKSATLYTAELDFAGEEAGTIHVSVREDADDVRVKIDALDGALEVSAEYAPTGDGAHIAANVRYAGNDCALTVDVQTGVVAAMTTAFYFDGMDTPLATEVNTFALTGARTIAIDAEGKTALALEDVVNDSSGARARLLADIMIGSGWSGLPGM